jgi:chromosomal replication initiator protein
MAGLPGHGECQARSNTSEGFSDVEEPALRAAVAERIGAARFGRWFGSGVRLAFNRDGDRLEVRVPDLFFREWIQRHYGTILLEAAETVLGRKVQLTIEIQDAIRHGLVDVAVISPTQRQPDFQPSRDDRDCDPVPPCVAPGSQHALAALAAAEPGASSGRMVPQPLLNGHRAARPLQPAGPSSGSRLPEPPGRPPKRLVDFVTGPGNRVAHAAAREMAQSAGAAFNPLVIHGGVGLGKTHLLEGIGHALREVHPARNVVQLTAEAFTNSFLEAMRAGTLNSFRVRFRGAGGMIVDDVHFLAAKRATQVEFLHTFNALFDKGAPIILAADQHPRLISRLPDELVTRLLGGMVVKIETPDQATRLAILRTKAAARGVHVPDPVIGYIAEHLRSSIRELEGALHTVIAQAVLTGKRIDLSVAKSALRDTVRHTAQSIALCDVERAVCELFQISADALRSDSRARALAYPRMLAMYLARKHTGAAYSEIGRHYGGRNHSTVISAEKKVHSWLRAEERCALLPGFESVADLVADLERTLGA